MKKAQIIGILCILLAAAILLFCNIYASPYDCLMENIGNQSVGEILCQEQLNDNKYLIFFLDESGCVSCAIIKKTRFSFRLLRTSGALSPNADSSTYMYSAFEDGDDYRWIDWGILTDPEIETVLIDGEQMNILNELPYGFRLCWLSGTNDRSTSALEHLEIKK